MCKDKEFKALKQRVRRLERELGINSDIVYIHGIPYSYYIEQTIGFNK